MQFFKDLHTRKDIAIFLGVPLKKLTHLLYIKGIDNCYTSFEIPKKSGGVRTINAPNAELKTILRKLASRLDNYQQQIWKDNNISPNISHGFVKKKSILSNAKIHIKKRYVLNIDLMDFFGSFHFGRVVGFFEKNKYFNLPHDVAVIFAQLTCYKGKLPQGAPTSPIITNLICQILDFRILALAKKFRLDYTRYADDLTFSTNDKNFINTHEDFLSEINLIMSRAGFSINDEKTKLFFKDSRQTVTGLIVNQKPNIERDYYKKTKSMALSLYKTGSFHIDGNEGSLAQLNGRFSFINQIEKNNNLTDSQQQHNFWNLSGKEKEYRKFLFYKLFIANEYPIIVTEGKTDIVYLKAALKNLHEDYPDLIEIDELGHFKFKIRFFSRTKTISYLFGVSKDGADAIKNIYHYFSKDKGDKKNYPDYKTLFHEKYSLSISQPILFLFDHEIESKKRPLYNFINYIGFRGTIKQSKLENELYVSIDEDKLYLVTNPLIADKKECEIEDLFSKETLAHMISGKTFSRQKDYNINKHFGKELFSKYIASNYESIDFTNFRKLLDTIVQIIKNPKPLN